MTPLDAYATPILRTVTSLWDGLSITLSHLLRRHGKQLLESRYRLERGLLAAIQIQAEQ